MLGLQFNFNFLTIISSEVLSVVNILQKILIFILIFSLLLTLKTFIDRFNLFVNFQNF